MRQDTPIVALALDQSPLATGWACGVPGDPKPAFGLFPLRKWGDDEGARLCQFEDWLTASIRDRRVTHLFYEAPVDMKLKSFDVTSKQNMQIGTIQVAAHRCRIPVAQVTPNDWRKRFLGVTKPVGVTGDMVRPELKRMAMKACALRGWWCEDDNVAEALGILDYALSTLSHRHAGSRDPIFRRAELQADIARFRGGHT